MSALAFHTLLQHYVVPTLTWPGDNHTPTLTLIRNSLQMKLQEIFEGLHSAHQVIESRLRAEQLKQRVLQCCRAWEEWAVYPPEFLISLQNIFLGLVKRVSLTYGLSY